MMNTGTAEIHGNDDGALDVRLGVDEVVAALAIEGEAVLLEYFDEGLVGNGLDGRHRIRGASLPDRRPRTPAPSIHSRCAIAGLTSKPGH